MPSWHPFCSGSLDSHVIFGIFVASLRAVGCAATLAAAGLVMARRGYMTPSVSRGLSHLSVKLLIPCLLFSSVVPGISFELLSYAWPLLLLPGVYLCVGTALGMLTMAVVDPPEDFRRGTVAACAFGNTTGIPIILLSVLQQSLSRQVFAELADPLLFLSLQLLTFPLFQWAVGLALLRRGGSLCGGSSFEPVSRLARSGPNSVSNSFISMLSVGEDDYLTHGILRPASVQERLSALVARTECRAACGALMRGAVQLLRRIFVPPVIGIAAGVLIGLFGRPLVLPSETAPLGWLFLGVSKLGAAAVPINLVLHGAAMSSVPERGRLPLLTGVGIVLCRMLFMPLCGLGVARVLTSSHLPVPALVADTFWLVCLIVTCTPTASNMVVMCELSGEDRRAMSASIFYQYCAAPVMLPGVLTLFVAFICRTRDVDVGFE